MDRRRLMQIVFVNNGKISSIVENVEGIVDEVTEDELKSLMQHDPLLHGYYCFTDYYLISFDQYYRCNEEEE